HLFAVSSVSGGSIGAATFAAALDAAGHAAATAPKAGGDLPAGPCPSIAEFLSNAHAKNELDKPGQLETKGDAAPGLYSVISPLSLPVFGPGASSGIRLGRWRRKNVRGLQRGEEQVEPAEDGLPASLVPRKVHPGLADECDRHR